MESDADGEGAEKSPAPVRGEAAVRFMVGTVAAALEVRAEDLFDPSRGPARVAFARQVAIYLAHTRLGLSFTRAGAVFGRDRTTASHGCRKVEERRDDRRVDAVIDVLEQAVGAWSGLAERL